MMMKLQKTAGVLPARRSVAAKAVAPKSGRVEQAAILATVAAVTLAAPAKADVEAPEVDTAVDTVISAVKATGEIVKSTLTTVEAGIKVLKDGFDIAAPAVEQAYKATAPVVQQVVKVTADAAGPAVKAALPSIQETLAGTGLTTKSVADATSAVTSATSSAVTTASPFVSKFLQFVASNDPVTLGEYALGLAVAAYVAPGILGLLGGSFRGFAGELAPAAALDLLVNEGNVALIDIRTAKEKEGSGIPDLPSSASSKTLEVEYAITEDKKLRGQLRDPSGIESAVTALQIASLKKIGKGTKVILLDRYGPAARTVAKELARKGYGKVFVIQGGFDGRAGWVQSKLQIKPAAILTSSAPPAIAKTVFTRGSKALPAPKST